MGQNTDFVKGALIGGILGGVAGLLVAPKSGKELRDDIADNYNSFSDKAVNFTNTLKEKGAQLAHPFRGEEENFSANGFLIGGALGAVIGATAALLLAPQSGEQLREGLGDQYESIRDKAEDFVANFNKNSRHALEQVGDWKDTLMTIVEKLSHGKKGSRGGSGMNDIVDWASLGIRLFQQLQKGR